MRRRQAVDKINSLPEASEAQLQEFDDVCAICYQEMGTARITRCNHYFHGVCLRKWLYVQDICPLCHDVLYVETDVSQQPTDNNNEPGAAAPAPAPAAEVPAEAPAAEAAVEQDAVRGDDADAVAGVDPVIDPVVAEPQHEENAGKPSPESSA